MDKIACVFVQLKEALHNLAAVILQPELTSTLTMNLKTKGGEMHQCIQHAQIVTGAAFCKSHLSSHARRLLAAAIRSTTEVRKSLGSLRVALPS